MLGSRLCTVLVVLAALTAIVRADDAVALLPLDAEPRLEIYGQPVASELARALAAGGVDVVVVGPKMAVPDRAKLVVDGTITASKADAVVLTLRMRNPIDGTTLGTTQSAVQGLQNIDKAAAELSAKLLPLVQKQLADMHAPIKKPVQETKTVAVVGPPAPEPMLFALVARSASDEPLRAALASASAPWAEQHHRTLQATDAKLLGRKVAPATVKQARGNLAIAFEVLDYRATQTTIPYATARVRVRVANAAAVLFDRVVVTNSVLGDKGIAPDALAARTAREVLDILRPHLKRLVGAW